MRMGRGGGICARAPLIAGAVVAMSNGSADAQTLLANLDITAAIL